MPDRMGCKCYILRQGKTPFLLIVLSLVGAEVIHQSPASLVPIQIIQQGRQRCPGKGKSMAGSRC